MKYSKGQRIKVTADSILSDCMGIREATGTVFCVSADGNHIIGFKCDQTGSIEGIENGTVSVEGREYEGADALTRIYGGKY